MFVDWLERLLVPCCGSESFLPKRHISWGQRWRPKFALVVEAALSKAVYLEPSLNQIFSCHTSPLRNQQLLAAERGCQARKLSSISLELWAERMATWRHPSGPLMAYRWPTFFCSMVLFRQSQFSELTGCVANRQFLALKDQSLVPSPPAPFISAICRHVAVPARQDGPANVERPRWPT
jgi:hypothetical protein